MAISPLQRNLLSFPEHEIIYILYEFFCSGNITVPNAPFKLNNCHPLQKQALCEALLWEHFLFEPESSCHEQIMDIRPFGEDTPTMSELFTMQGTVAMFPICSAEKAELCFLYLLKKNQRQEYKDHRSCFVDNNIISNDILIFVSRNFSPLASNIDGNSWQLAYWMAFRALSWNNITFKQQLSRWIITGAVDQDAVKSVIIDKKQSLIENLSDIKFMLPADNADAVNSVTQEKCSFVCNIDQAWRIISGSGFEMEKIELPAEIEQLHILIGGAINPVLTTILQLAPKIAYLWCSQSSYSIAEQVQKQLKMCDGINIDFQIRIMDSHNLQQSFIDMNNVFENISDKSNSVICNTGGNRLMGTAALLIAQTYEINTVYRDIDAKQDYLTVIKFKAGQRLIADIEINRCPVKDKINWHLLFSKENIKPQSNIFI